MTLKEIQRRNSARLFLVQICHAFGQGGALAIACLIAYALITRILTRAYFISRDDDLLGGMWAVAATVFVYRESYKESARAAMARMMATLLSFILCLGYLLIFPFHAWGMAVLIGISAAVLTLVGRQGDIITTGITIAVVMVVAGMGPQHAWREPILRLVDTVVGTAVGTAAAWISLKLGSRSRPAPLTLEQSTSAALGNWKGRT